MRTKHINTRRFKIESVNEEGIIKGHLSIFNIADRGKETVRPGAFKKTLSDRGNRPFPFLWQHDTRNVIGQFIAEETQKGLYATIKLNLLERNGRLLNVDAGKAYASYKAGDIDSFSFGYYVIKDKRTKDGTDLLELQLLEGSAATIPMHPSALVEEVKSLDDIEIQRIIEAFESLKVKASRTPTRRQEPNIIEALYYAAKEINMI